MPRSRVIRMGLFVLMLGVGIWGVLILPSFSQDPDQFNRQVGNVPIAVPSVDSFGGSSSPMGAAPFVEAPSAGGGSPAGATFDPNAGAIPGTLDPNVPGVGGDFQAAGAPGTAAPPGGGYAPAAGPPGMGSSSMMGSMMSSGGMGPMMGMGQPTTPEIQLARQAKNLLTAYSHETKAEVKEKLKSQLRAVLHQQFRLQHQRRDAELTKVERRLADLRARLKKRGDAQSTIVDRRLEQLVNDVDGLGWSAEEIPDNLFNDGGMGSMMMPGMPSMPMGPGTMMRPGFGVPQDPNALTPPLNGETPLTTPLAPVPGFEGPAAGAGGPPTDLPMPINPVPTEATPPAIGTGAPQTLPPESIEPFPPPTTPQPEAPGLTPPAGAPSVTSEE